MASTKRPLLKGYVLAQDKTHAYLDQPIESSANDDRHYRMIRLPNDLEVLLIHDPNTDKSAAALDVHVGHLSDPDHLQGLAHFLEHLLFMGTAKYPKENAYKEFLAQHSGRSNAFTSLDNTNYYFEVGHAHFEGALDRFAQFFISPAFSENCKDREIRAVDSEYKKNLQMDSRRLFQLGKALSNPHHPYCHFGTGNLTTLVEEPKQAGVNVRDELIQFYHKYYSANIMKLVVLGREPLDQLGAWAIEKFSAVKNLDIVPPAYPHGPLTTTELMKMTYVKPVKELRSLELKFPFPDQKPHYTVHPERYLCHLLGHEGSGSIYALLKRKGWANGLSAGNSPAGIGFEFLKVTVDLTEEGLAHWEEIVLIVFQYIAMLRQEGVKIYIWSEVASIASTAFAFKEKTPAAGYVSDLAGTMQRGYAPQWVLTGAYLINGLDRTLIQECIDALQVDQWRGQVVTQDSSAVPGGVFTQKERWYGTEYHVDNVPARLKERLQEVGLHPELHLPPPNDFIPEDFETHKVVTDSPLTRPLLVKHTPLTRIWYKKDDIFWVPKVNLFFRLKSPFSYASPENNVKTQLYVNLVKDALNEYTYDAKIMGLTFSLDTTAEGIVLKVGGYNHKALVLLQRVVAGMKNLVVEPERFEVIHDQMERLYRNLDLEAPYQQAMYFMSCLTQEKHWTREEKLVALKEVTIKDIQEFYPVLLGRLHVEGLVHGNMSSEEALKAGEMIERELSPKALTPSESVLQRSVLLPESLQAVYQRPVPDMSNLNSGIEYYLQVPEGDTVPSRARVQILAQIVQEPCFNQLRTLEQLGYIVSSSVRQHGGSAGLRIIVQSERDPRHVEARIEAFLEGRIATLLKEMTEEEYQKQVQSLLVKKLESDKNLRQETVRYWKEIESGYYDFDRLQKEVHEMERITLEELRLFFEKWMVPSTVHSRKLSVHLRSRKLSETDDKDKVGTIQVKDLTAFKASLELSRAPYPVVDLLRYSKL